MDKKTEADIIARVLAGNRQAYALLVEEYKTAIYNLAYRMTGNSQDAQDLAQESFIRAYKNLAVFDPRRSFFTWLYTISLNLIRNYRKKKKRESSTPAVGSFSPDLMPAADKQDTAMEELLELSLTKLSPEIRELIVLRYYQGLSFEHIAEITGLSTSAVKMRIYRGLEKLQKYFEIM
jgi:RNA polymerase sigma-70 factor (ECF subfamily)